MKHTMKELSAVAGTKTPRFLAWDGAKCIVYRLTDTERSWYFRGTLKTGTGSEPVLMNLGLSKLRKMTAQFLDEESVRLRGMCAKGIDPRIQESSLSEGAGPGL